MATLEKPKKEKSKKTKVKSKNDDLGEIHEKEGNFVAPINVDSATLDSEIEELSKELEQFEVISVETKEDKNDEIPSSIHEIENNFDTDDKYDEDVGTHPEEPENVSLHEELAQAMTNSPTTNKKNETTTTNETVKPWTESFEQTQMPTAPPADVASIAPLAAVVTASPIIQYPSLTTMLYVETKSTVTYQPVKSRSTCFSEVQSQLKPYTSEQLKQIYTCNELELVKQFELEFLMNSLLESYETDPLYAALLEYYNLQSKIHINLQDIGNLRKDAFEKEADIWTKVPITKTFPGKCADNVSVQETVTYNIAKVDGKNLEIASAALTRLFELVCFTYTTNQIAAQVTKVKIDQIINEVISYPRVATICQNATISLNKTLDSDTLQCMTHLRRAITIIFSFIRRVSPNANFDADLKQWLNKLVSLHLLLATREDHWFLLFNILRCPSGVGNWATKFIQVPCSYQTNNPSAANNSVNELPLPIDSPEVNNCIAVLQILLFPIKKRNEYLKAFTQSHKEISDPAKEERWIFIDSDGEDSHNSSGECIGLKESDLISLLNQIPFERLFSSVLGTEKFLEDYIIEADLISAGRMLKVVAFFSKLIEIFGEGMLTYNTERYKQFAKRLGRLVRHTLQYVFDYQELFICNKLSKDPSTCERIAVELNALLMKACSYIYRTRNLATWQYYSSLPFGTLDIKTVWQLFYYLNVGFPTEFPIPQEDHIEKFNATDFWMKFNIANSDVSAEDIYYLLQAFFEIAHERDKVKDWELIKVVCIHIFNIGYINEPTRDICYKASRDMLVNITLAYEDLMSCLLLQLKIRFNEVENAAYLFKSLPLENWKPSMDSFEILSNWLLHYDFQSAENMIARIVISHLNWGLDSDGRLFLPHNIHLRMACLITEALTKHAPEVIGVSTLTESVRQVSNLIDFSQSTKEHFSSWCWSMVSLLRLHLMDQSKESRKKTLLNPTEPLLFVPELERIDTIFQGVTENRPLAIYVALLVSLHGHSIPIICQKGFDLMKLLLNDYRHAAVIRALEVIVPLFLESADTLANCESFHVIINNLLNADKTYLKMAKDVIYPNTVGPVLELFDNMIHHQITSYTDYGLSSPLNLIYIWLKCFTSLPNWQNTSVVYLLDKLLRVAYQFPDSRTQTLEFFRNYYKDCNDWKTASKASTIKTFFGGSQSRIPTLSPFQPWMSLFLLEIEFKMQDLQFWSEFLRQLSVQSSKSNLDAALKKTAAIVQMPNFPVHMLVIYKYANLVANMDINHPLFPIINQKFFELFLSRVPMHYDEESFQNTCGVSDKFYEYNIPLMKKIKTNLKAAETLYKNESTKRADDEAISYFYRNCAKMMKAFELWLEETTINKFSKDTNNFPPQYNNEKLREILNGNTPHWTEFLYLPAIRKEQRYQAEQWARKCFRLKSIKNLRSPIEPKMKRTAMERIKVHLRSYDKYQEPPKYVKPTVLLHKEINDSTFKDLKEELKTLKNCATKFNFQTCELNALNRNFLDTIQQLYKMVSYQDTAFKSCNSLIFNRKCSSPANIVTTLERIHKDESVQNKVDAYHERHDKIVDEMLIQKLDDFAYCVEKIGCTIRTLITSQISSSVIKSTGIKFFYAVIENMTDITMKFPPTNDCFSQLLNETGIFIQDNQEEQGLVILDLALKRPDLLKVLSGVFVPYRTRPEYFIKMYKFLIDSHLKRCDTNILFVLFSKFDLEAWLSNFHLKLYDIQQLLQLILQGLESWSQPDTTLLQDQFRRHLVHVFKHNFPEHYGEVLHMVLSRISEQKLMPIVLTDLLNALLSCCKCTTFDLDTKDDQIHTISMDFARVQNLFNFTAANDTVLLFARHFQKERLNHGLHGLYPKHKDYCKPLAMWFSCFGHVLSAAAICTYQDLLADQLSDLIFSSIIDMYAPWLIVYTEQIMQQHAPSKWIQKLTENGQMLLPWSAQHTNTSKIIIKTFVNTLRFILDNLPCKSEQYFSFLFNALSDTAKKNNSKGRMTLISHLQTALRYKAAILLPYFKFSVYLAASQQILAHTFGWYIHHFTIPNLESSTYVPIHEGIAALPWELFKPQPNYIEMIHESLQRYVPEAHAMLGHIFIRIDWNGWFAETLPKLTAPVQLHTVSRLFTVFIKIAFEPNIHGHPNASKVFEDAIKYPWYLVNYEELETLLKWFAGVVEPSIILKIPTENNNVDQAVLNLLRFSCAMMPERPSPVAISQDSAKRVLYIRAFIRLLRGCATKNQKLLATKDGLITFNAIFAELLNRIDRSVHTGGPTTTLEQQQREALNMIVEIVMPMATQNQEVSNFQINTMIEWQQQVEGGNLLTSGILTAIGNMRTFIAAIYTLLEATLVSYFRTSEETKDFHRPSWSESLRLLQHSLDKLELMPIIRGPNYLTLHIFLVYRLNRIENSGDQITFLQDVIQLTESFKTNLQTESHLAIVWGIIIARGCKILSTSEHAKKPLLMFARSLYVQATQAESWGEGLLGAIGLKRDSVTNKRKVLARCLVCVLFALFPDTSASNKKPNQEYLNSMQELSSLLSNKKFNDVKPLITKAESILDENKFPDLRDVPHLICRLIAVFYVDNFLTTIPEIWDFNFKL